MASTSPASTLSVRAIPAPPQRPLIRTVDDAVAAARTAMGLTRVGRWQRRNQATESWARGLEDVAAFRAGHLPLLGTLFARVVRRDGTLDDLGLISCRVVTTAGMAYVVDAMQGLTDISLLKYHGVGTGTGGEAASNTTLGSELTTAYATANTRPTGTAGETSGQSTTFETAATVTVSASVALTEHGIFSRAAVGGGTLLDRSVFSAVNLAATESLQVTYALQFPAGS